MNKKIEIQGLTCHLSPAVNTSRIAYILYPMPSLASWLEPAAKKYGITLVSITDMDWENVFSPWPAAAVPAGTADFKGESPEFLKLLTQNIVPEVEKTLGINTNAERTLVGVSMSGLFALWQWPQTDVFDNIVSLSGSFWYEGFMEWFGKQNFSNKKGFAYFLLGIQEPKSKVKAFDCVGEHTEAIVKSLKDAGVDVEFQWVPGNHYSNPLPRLDAALTALSQNYGFHELHEL